MDLHARAGVCDAHGTARSGGRRTPGALAALLIVALVGGLVAAVPTLAPGIPGLQRSSPPRIDDTALDEAFGRLPVRFEENLGQTDPKVAFSARGSGYGLFLTSGEAVLTSTPGRRAGGAEVPPVVRMAFPGADPAVRIDGTERLPGVSNYLLGDDPSAWRSNVPGYSGATYRQLYPGIDLAFYGRRGHVEYDYILAPGADADDIRLAFPGADRVHVAANGDLVVTVGKGEIRQPRPVVYQGSGATRRSVDGDFVVRPDGDVGFLLGAYDRSQTLVIDPVLTYSTFLGGTGSDGATAVRADAAGNAYVTGNTGSTNFTVVGAAYGTNAGGTDGFVSKLNPAGTALVYSTYFGGNGADSPTAIALDGAGNTYLTGSTASTNFPMVGAVQGTKGSGTDAFVAKLNAAGNALAYSTHLGAGTATGDADIGRGIAVDSTGRASVAGETRSSNFVTTAAAYQTAFAGGTCPTAATGTGATTPCRDAFVTTFNAAGSAIDYSTFLGGTNEDNALAIAVDSADKLYLTGETRSLNFDVVAGAVQAAHAGGTCAATFEATRPCRDAFVSKIDPVVVGAGSLVYSTFLGGNTSTFLSESLDSGLGIDVDSTGAAYVAGQTTADDFPVASPLQATRAGESDAFVTKLNASGTGLTYSTYLGGPSTDNANAIAVDPSGAAHLVGSSNSAGMPMVDPVAMFGGNGDAFVAKLNAAGSALLRSTYLGGHNSESGAAVATDAAGNTYAVGSTSSGGPLATTAPTGNFPTMAGGVQTAYGQGGDAFMSKIAAPANALAPLVTSLNSTTGPTTGGTTVVITGSNLASPTAVTFGGTPAASVTPDSATQITAVSPAGGLGPVDVVVTTAQGSSPANPIARFNYGEGTWTRTGSPTTSRFAQTETLLADGRVLSVGGRASSGGAAIASAEVYDPVTGTWTPTGSLNTARFVHTATLLTSGKVLVTGGFAVGLTSNAQNVLNDAEIWDPATGVWTVVPATMTAFRAIHMSALLPNGKVLLGGGRTCTAAAPTACDFTFVTGTTELYDPVANTFTATGPFQFGARHTTSFVLLDSGKVLVPGGFPGNGTTTAELYDPATGAWSFTGAMTSARARPTVTKLANGKVLISGGFPNTIATSAEIYDPVAATWSPAGTTTTSRFNAAAALLPSGKVLVAGGGQGGATAEIYNPASPAVSAWRSEGAMSAVHGSASSNTRNHNAILLSTNCGANCGKVLLVGNNGEPVADLYTPPGVAGLYHPVTPARILDTRNGTGSCTPAPCAQLGSGGNPNTIGVQVTGQGGVPAAGVSAVVMNVTVTQPSTASVLTVFPSDVAQPTVSNLNYVAGETVPNSVTVKVGVDGKVNINNAFGSVHVIADVAGWYTDDTGTLGARFNALSPSRIMDTRTATGACVPSPCAKLGSGGNPNTIDVQIAGLGGVPASGSTAVVMNVTVTEPSTSSVLTVWPSDVAQPTVSNLNYVANQTVPNVVTVKLGPDGKVKVNNAFGDVHAIFDVAGWYSTDAAGTGARFTAVSPSRILDTRDGTGTCTPSPCAQLVGNGGELSLLVAGQGGVPATGATAVVMNGTVTQPTAASVLTVWPSDVAQPAVSNLNFVAGQTVPNLVVVKLGADGRVKVNNAFGDVHVISDVAGWFNAF